MIPKLISQSGVNRGSRKGSKWNDDIRVVADPGTRKRYLEVEGGKGESDSE